MDSELLGQARQSKAEIEEIEIEAERGGASTQKAGCRPINAPADAGEWGVPDARPGRSHRRDTDAAEDNLKGQERGEVGRRASPCQDRPDTEIGPGEGRGRGRNLKGRRARRGPLSPLSSSLSLLGPVTAVPAHKTNPLESG